MQILLECFVIIVLTSWMPTKIFRNHQRSMEHTLRTTIGNSCSQGKLSCRVLLWDNTQCWNLEDGPSLGGLAVAFGMTIDGSSWADDLISVFPYLPR